MSWFRRDKGPSGPPKAYWVPKIQRDVLRLVCASARSQHPNEFAAVLRAHKDTITEILVLPGTVSGDTHAIFQLHMMPIDFSAKGTVHSHPSSNPNPSQADRELFARYGTTHIIVAEPYDLTSWRAYNAHGDPVRLEVVD